MFVFLHFSVHVRVHVHCPSALRREKALLCLPIHSLVLVLIVIQNELKRRCFVYSRKRQLTRVRLTFSQPRMILSVHTLLPWNNFCVYTQKEALMNSGQNNCAQWFEQNRARIKLLCVAFMFLAVPKCSCDTEQKTNVHVRKREKRIRSSWMAWTQHKEWAKRYFPAIPPVSVRVLVCGQRWIKGCGRKCEWEREKMCTSKKTIQKKKSYLSYFKN